VIDLNDTVLQFNLLSAGILRSLSHDVCVCVCMCMWVCNDKTKTPDWNDLILDTLVLDTVEAY